MQKWLINLLLAIFILTFDESKLSANENRDLFIESSTQEGYINSEYIFLDTLKDIKLDQDTLVLEMNGNHYLLESLQKIGNQWVAGFNGYCPAMHPLCECGQCHNSRCYYYAKDCPRRK